MRIQLTFSVQRYKRGEVMSITFCIVTFDKTRWLANALTSIRKHCPVEYSVRVFINGEPDEELKALLTQTEKITVMTSSRNIGASGGRKLLTRGVTTEYTMILDDDMYLTEGAIDSAMEVFHENERIGGVGLPHTNPEGRLMSPGGKNLIIRDGVIRRAPPRLESEKKLIEVEDLDGGAMIMRTKMLKDFEWDDRYGTWLEDIDKSLQILRDGKWKQAIAPKARLIHDRSWLNQKPEYVRVRLNGLSERRSYNLFRSKWGLRLDFRMHLNYELIFPFFTLIGWQWPRIALDHFTRERSYKE